MTPSDLFELGVSLAPQTVARAYTYSAVADESDGRHEVRQGEEDTE